MSPDWKRFPVSKYLDHIGQTRHELERWEAIFRQRAEENTRTAQTHRDAHEEASARRRTELAKEQIVCADNLHKIAHLLSDSFELLLGCM